MKYFLGCNAGLLPWTEDYMENLRRLYLPYLVEKCNGKMLKIRIRQENEHPSFNPYFERSISVLSVLHHLLDEVHLKLHSTIEHQFQSYLQSNLVLFPNGCHYSIELIDLLYLYQTELAGIEFSQCQSFSIRLRSFFKSKIQSDCYATMLASKKELDTSYRAIYSAGATFGRGAT
jgi:hypothetical protein